MSDWVHIDEPAAKPLTYLQRRIMELMQQGKSFGQICGILLIRSDHLRDEIFEIRKYEALMGEKKRLTDEQKAVIIEMRQAGKPYKEISEAVGCAKQTVVTVWNAFVHSDKPAKKTGINPEFDAAVNDMIEEMHAEETAEPEEIEQVTEPVVMTEEHTAAPPDVVRKAVLYRIADIDDECNKAEAAIKSLRTKIGALTKERGELEIWLSEAQI